MKILILGAGYAGLACATKLRPLPDIDVTLIEQNPYHTFETRLHEAAAHNTQVTLPIQPLLRGTGVTLKLGKILNVDLDAKTVTSTTGTDAYDRLVIALGSVTNFYRIPGLADHASELKTAEDAEEIFSWLNLAHSPTYTGPRRVVIGGAGLTGVELATEIARRTELLHLTKGTKPLEIYLIEAGPTILPALDDHLREKVETQLKHYGIEIRTKHRLIQANAHSVVLQTEGTEPTELATDKIVWTGGIQAQDIVFGTHLTKGTSGRIDVDTCLRMANYPEVFVIGDMGLAKDKDGTAVPTTAQHAGQQGRLTAKNLIRLSQNQEPKAYEPHILGEFVSLGGLMAVGWMKLPWNQKIALSGSIAHVMKRASHWRWRVSVE